MKCAKKKKKKHESQKSISNRRITSTLHCCTSVFMALRSLSRIKVNSHWVWMHYFSTVWISLTPNPGTNFTFFFTEPNLHQTCLSHMASNKAIKMINPLQPDLTGEILPSGKVFVDRGPPTCHSIFITFSSPKWFSSSLPEILRPSRPCVWLWFRLNWSVVPF